MNISPETPQVFQSKQREGFIRGRRSSVVSAVEQFELEEIDDSSHDFDVRERTFTIRFEAYDEIQVSYIQISTTVASMFVSPHSCAIPDDLAPKQLFQQGNKTDMVSF